MKRFLLSGIPELFLLSLAFMLGEGERLISIIAVAVIHELGHVIAAAILGVKIRFYSAEISGFSLRYDFSATHPLKEVAVCLAGPALGLCVFLFGYSRGSISCFSGASAALSVFNLLPISYLDGGCALFAFLSLFFSPDTVWRACRTLSVVFTLVLWCMAVLILLRANGDISAIAVVVYLLYRLFLEY